ncbi:3-hydroxyacyl-CoA dehydrogenase NAD-binding domain-containing protein [Halovenus salina]|uniref:3-hydroxyacyl-CoA dehydrogenase NAD-binding domain-containing protein n=1 Tax=Halovenus salina TaxID=1510225 RepID=A0ABD5W3V7_9EURY
MNIGVLGADERAREVAAACVRAGERVRLYDSEATAVMDSIDTVERRLGDDGIEATDCLEATTGVDAAVADVDVVIDTTHSDAAALQDWFAELEGDLDDDILVASAVPAVSVTRAAAGLRLPERAVGFRFHQPPNRSSRSSSPSRPGRWPPTAPASSQRASPVTGLPFATRREMSLFVSHWRSKSSRFGWSTRALPT